MNVKRLRTELEPEESCSKKGIQDLPDELLCLVFSFLALEDLVLGARRVCQRWKAVADDNSLWETYVFPYDTYEPEEALDIIRESPNLRHVFFNAGYPHKSILKALSEHCAELRGIEDFSVSEDNVEGFEAVLELCPKLENVVLADIIPNPRNVLHLVGKCRNLKELSVCFSTTETGIFDSITEGCPMLQYLSVACCEYRCRDLSLLLKKIGHQLIELCFRCCLNDADEHCVLPDVARYCRRLKVLHIDWHKGPLQNLNAFFESGNGQNLRHIHLEGFQTNDLLCTSVFQVTPNLIFLNLSFLKIRDKHLKGVRTLSTLTYLNLDEFTGPSDEAVRNIAQCKRLKALCLPRFEGTDENFVTFCKELPHLEKLDLSSTEVTAMSLLLVPDRLRKLLILYVGTQCVGEADLLLLKGRMPSLIVYGSSTH